MGNRFTADDQDEILAWRVRPWAEAVSLSTSYVNVLIRQKIISSVKAGSVRLITTSPRDYLDRLAQQDVEYSTRGRPIREEPGE